MKKVNFIIGTIFFFMLSHSDIFGEEIRIDSTFHSSCEIFPFEEIGLITNLSLTADIKLNHDTSLVRIIFVPYDENEYMIFEAFPLIVEDLSFTVRETCDETCFLNQLRPYSVKLQIINAEVTLTSLNYSFEEMENLPQLQYTAKRNKDEQKIEAMISRIAEYDLKWTADDNSIVSKYYYEKKEMFGEEYNLLGFEYYNEGLYEFIKYVPNPAGDYVIVYFNPGKEEYNSLICLHDITGKLIRKVAVGRGENQVVFDLKGLSNGLYLVTLYSQGNLAQCNNLIIIKD